MTEKELKIFTINFINDKASKSDNFVKYSFYELKVKYNLSDDEINYVLKVSKDYFENKNYKVYFTNDKYEYKGNHEIVQSNEFMIAIKE